MRLQGVPVCSASRLIAMLVLRGGKEGGDGWLKLERSYTAAVNLSGPPSCLPSSLSPLTASPAALLPLPNLQGGAAPLLG